MNRFTIICIATMPTAGALLAACGVPCHKTKTCGAPGQVETDGAGGNAGGQSGVGGAPAGSGGGGAGGTSSQGGGQPVLVSRVATGGSHSCVVMTDGSMRCWGKNDSGQLGNGNNVASSTPQEVISLPGEASRAALGSDHSCARLTDGTVACWGMNDKGQLGTGTTSPSSVPILIPALANVTAICAGLRHSCAIQQDGTVRCWGDNAYGQLGDGTTTTSPSPVPVALAQDAKQLACGGEHTCATVTNGQAYCWGRNSVVGGFGGQLGNGTWIDSPDPVVVQNLSSATVIEAGGGHTCAIEMGGATKCWGQNLSGQLGVGDQSSYNTAQDVALAGASSIAAGLAHSCALAQGALHCWGENGDGQLGLGDIADRLEPVSVPGTTMAGEIDLGQAHSCARLADGTASCWGDNQFGQLGDGTTTDRDEPVQVVGLD